MSVTIVNKTNYPTIITTVWTLCKRQTVPEGKKPLWAVGRRVDVHNDSDPKVLSPLQSFFMCDVAQTLHKVIRLTFPLRKKMDS